MIEKIKMWRIITKKYDFVFVCKYGLIQKVFTESGYMKMNKTYVGWNIYSSMRIIFQIYKKPKIYRMVTIKKGRRKGTREWRKLNNKKLLKIANLPIND